MEPCTSHGVSATRLLFFGSNDTPATVSRGCLDKLFIYRRATELFTAGVYVITRSRSDDFAPLEKKSQCTKQQRSCDKGVIRHAEVPCSATPPTVRSPLVGLELIPTADRRNSPALVVQIGKPRLAQPPPRTSRVERLQPGRGHLSDRRTTVPFAWLVTVT